MWTRDNLDVLRGLNSESVDLVYADPPFNSNKNYEAPIGSDADAAIEAASVVHWQLLCGACNRATGSGTQAELIAKLKERREVAA